MNFETYGSYPPIEPQRPSIVPITNGESLAVPQDKGIKAIHHGIGIQASLGDIPGGHIPNDAASDMPHDASQEQRTAAEGSEITPPGGDATDIVHRPNVVTDFILDSLAMYEELNADTLEEGKQKWQEAAQAAVRGATLGEQIGEGGLMQTHAVVGTEQLVIKRYRPGSEGESDLSPYNPEIDRRFAVHADTHRFLAEAFGREHIPDTEFVIVDGSSFGGGEPFFVEGREYVMLQERVKGIQFGGAARNTRPEIEAAAAGASDAIRAQVDGFVSKYRQIQATGFTPENQIILDFGRERVMVIDTNQPYDFRREVDESVFVRTFYQGDTPIQTPQAAADFVLSTSSLFEPLQGRPWTEVRENFHMGSSLVRLEENILNASYGDDYEFREFVGVLDQFPPEGDNKYIRDIIDMGLTSGRIVKDELGTTS